MKVKSPQGSKDKLDKHYGDSVYLIRTVYMQICGVAIITQVMLNVLDVLLQLLFQKSLIKSRIC